MFKKIKRKTNLFHGALFFLFFLVLLSPKNTHGVTLYIDPSSTVRKIGDYFEIDIKMDVKDECVNAMRGEVYFPAQFLEGVHFSKSKSILSLWPEPPVINNDRGRVSFAGGIPGGYCKRGGEDVLVGSIIFKTKEVEREVTGDIVFNGSSQVLLDDGLATPSRLEKKMSFFVIVPEIAINPINPLEKRASEDKTVPEFSYFETRKDDFFFDGKNVLLFYAVDKDSEIDYYMVSEQKRFGFLPVTRENWKIAESPYILEDQDLRSIIKIKAVDVAGNEKVEVIYPPTSWQDVAVWVIFLIMLIVVFFLKRKLKSINHNK